MGERGNAAKDRDRGRQLRAAAEERLARTPGAPRKTTGKTAEKILHELQVHQIELDMQNEELKRAQVALEESRDKYVDLYDFAPVGYFTLTGKGEIAEANLAGAALLGVGRPKLVRRGLGRFVAPEDRDRWAQHLVSVLQAAEKQTCELAIKREDGSTFDAHLDSLRLDRPAQEAGAGGPGPVIRVAMSDISHLKRAEALRESEEKYRTLFQTMAQGVVYQDADGKIFSANPAAEKILGLSLDPLRGRTFVDPRWRAIHEDGSDFPGETHPSMVALRTGQEVRDVVMGVFNPRHESYVWISMCAVPQFRPGESQPHQVYTTFDDITERKWAKETLRDSEERFRTLVEAVTDYTYRVTVRDGRAVETTHGPGCLPVTGYSSEELHADPELWFRMVHPGDRPAVFDQAAKLSSGQKTPPMEHRIIHKNGEIRWVRNTTVPRYDDRGQYAGYEGLVQDITECRKLQEQFAQAQKMEAIGLLAGGVAHDFRNQLTVIKGYGEMLLRRALVKDAGAEPLEYILKAADRSATIAGQLLAFSRQQMLRPEVVNVDSLAGDTMKSLAKTLGEDIRLSVMPCGDLWNIRVDTGQFQQALLNLVLNARDAMPQGGQLTIETGNIVLDEDFVRRHAGASAGRYLVLTVSDTGAGIAPEVLDHLFEPFFTIKPVGKGTGLGLAMVHGFVAQSGGFIEVQSQPGQGTAFRLYFPAVEDVAESAGRPSQAPDLLRGSSTVLVVEDEEAIRRILLETLGECGYTVLSAVNGQEAMTLIESARQKIDLLITDVVMPGWTGPELARRFQAARPGVPVLMISGHTGKMLTGHGVVLPDVNLLIKPFSAQTLAQTVQKVLCQPKRP
jgi:PAS domain S-box-containing protein